jgi:hypothetical protein
MEDTRAGHRFDHHPGMRYRDALKMIDWLFQLLN